MLNTPTPAAGALSLRVSVATLARVRFAHPESGAPLLALERKASVAARVGAASAGAPSAGAPSSGAVSAGAPSAGAMSAGAPRADAGSAGAAGAGELSAGAPRAGAMRADAPSASAASTGAVSTGAPIAYGPAAHVHAQPFGGGMRLRQPTALQAAIGAFEFDSQRSREEDDFRLLIRPEAWEAVQQFCRQHFADDDPLLEADPARELAEEFADALGVTLAPEQYRQRPLGALVATRLTPTLSPRAAGMVTARIYRLFEVEILDGALARAMLANSQRHTDDDLAQQALAQARAGGHGRANAVLALPLRALTQAYLALPPEARAAPLLFEQHTLDANVPVVLEGLALPDFRNL